MYIAGGVKHVANKSPKAWWKPSEGGEEGERWKGSQGCYALPDATGLKSLNYISNYGVFSPLESDRILYNTL